jgi:endonuclease/exonuclease/phosphatase family metal-dependent hydrolase
VGVALLAVVFALFLQVLRVLLPIAFEHFEGDGYALTGLATVAVIGIGPLLAPLLRRGLGDRRAVLVAVGMMVLGRIALQVVGTIPLWLAAATTVFALLALLLIVLGGRAGPSPLPVQGLLLGFALDVAVQGAFRTWDPMWQEGAVPMLVAVGFGAAALILASRSTPLAETQVSPLGLIALGPFLFLHATVLQDPGGVVFRSGFSLVVVVIVIVVVDAVSIVVLDVVGRSPSVFVLGAGAVGVIGLLLAPGPAILIPLALAACSSAAMLAMAFRPERDPSLILAMTGGAGGAALFAVLLIASQKDRPLPFSADLLLLAAAALLLVLAWKARRGRSRDPVPRGGAFALGAIGLLAVPIGSWLAVPAMASPPRPAGAVRLVDYNVHSAVNDQGQVVLETIARTIEGYGPSIVVLQEVSPGSPAGGMTDVVGWLSWRLGMRSLFVPSLDDRFGVAILYRPTIEVESLAHGLLPPGPTPHQRSYLLASFVDGARGSLRVVATHLDAETDPRYRLAEIEFLLRVIGDPADTVVAGDLNAPLGSPELGMLQEFGFVSVQEMTGERDPTFPETGEAVDHVLLGPGLTATDVAVDPSHASDHRAVVATILRT